jgi:hypothetical protein
MKNALLLACAALLAASCTQKKESKRPDEEEIKARSELKILAAKHNAATGWFTSWLGDSSETNASPKYTFQIKQDLMREDGRAVLLQCNLRDVDRSQDGFVLQADLTQLWNPNPGYLRLKCSSNLMATILRGPRRGGGGGWDIYAVVARITSVSRPSLQLKAETGDEGIPYVAVDRDALKLPFAAEGECIDLLPLDCPVFDF